MCARMGCSPRRAGESGATEWPGATEWRCPVTKAAPGHTQDRTQEKEFSVLLADSNVGIRRGFSVVLQQSGFGICAEVADGEAALAAARRGRPDLCVIDLRLPGGGLRALARISAELPGAAVVLIGDEIEDEDLFQALRLGARGFLFKSTSPERLSHALRRVLRGEAVIPRSLVSRLTNSFRTTGSRRHVVLRNGQEVQLTGREWEILDLLRQDLSTHEIAEQLMISAVTVRRHISSTLKKLRVDSRAAAAELVDPRSSA